MILLSRICSVCVIIDASSGLLIVRSVNFMRDSGEIREDPVCTNRYLQISAPKESADRLIKAFGKVGIAFHSSLPPRSTHF